MNTPRMVKTIKTPLTIINKAGQTYIICEKMALRQSEVGNCLKRLKTLCSDHRDPLHSGLKVILQNGRKVDQVVMLRKLVATL